MQAKQRTQGADLDAAPKSRLTVSARTKTVARGGGYALIAGFLLCVSTLLGTRISGAGSALLFSCLLLAASVWDIRKRIIPDNLCLGIAAAGFLTFSPVKLLGILPALLLLGASLLLRGGTGMGGGDIKLTAASGFAIGLPAVSAGIILGMALSLVYYVPLHFIRKYKTSKGQAVNETALPLVPFLSIGFIAATIIEIIGGTTL